MNRTNIEWADYTWNPIIGCDYGCEWCYAKKIARRFKMIKEWTKPEFREYMIAAPAKIKTPSIIFTGSMAGIRSEGVELFWLMMMERAMEETPMHTYMILEKRPNLFNEFFNGENIYIGTSIEYTSSGKKRIEELRSVSTRSKKFVSIEPLMGDVSSIDFSFADLVIVGAMTGPKANTELPLRSWIDGIKHPNIFFKENIRLYYPELPKGSKQQIQQYLPEN